MTIAECGHNMMTMLPQVRRRFIWCGALLLAIILTGTIGYWFIGGKQYSFVDTLYMTVITVATIGYGEIVDLSGNPGGRLFTIFIAIAGIGTLTYFITNFTGLVVEGALTESLRRRKMQKMANNYQDHYIVCGFGVVGSYITRELRSTRRRCVIVDMDKGVVEKALQSMPDQVALEGDATNNDTLIEAGIERAKGLFAVAGDDNRNLVISLTAKHLNPRVRVVAQCTDIRNDEKIRRAGADAVVSPRFIGGLRMTSEMLRPTVVSFLDMMLQDSDRRLQVEEIILPEAFIGKAISALDLKRHPQTLILAVKTRDDWLYNPPRDYVVQTADILVYISTPEGKEALEKFLQAAQ
ncbi:MAG: potassium channel protein [Chloroflexi bacterium]|nr:potassium channel protein [Chloroflexota bacterium]